MVAQSKILELLPQQYGYVILTATASHIVNMWMAWNVGRARRVHKINASILLKMFQNKSLCNMFKFYFFYLICVNIYLINACRCAVLLIYFLCAKYN